MLLGACELVPLLRLSEHVQVILWGIGLVQQEGAVRAATISDL
jgi:hypothetical protein